MNLKGRVGRLEAAAVKIGAVTLAEVVAWSLREEANSPQWREFVKRCEDSWLCRLIVEAGAIKH